MEVGLERLYQKYGELCSFTHGLGQANLLKIVFDKRSLQSEFFSDAERAERFQRVVVGEAYLVSFFSIVQSTSELTLLYPNDMDLPSAAIDAWKTLCEASFLTKAVWEMRTSRLLRVIA